MKSLGDDLGELMVEAARVMERCGAFERAAALAQEAANQARASEREARVEALCRRGVYRKHAVALAGALRSSAALAVAQEWHGTDPESILVLSGRPGCGKTLAAAWCVEHGPASARFVPVRKLMRVSPYSETEMATLESCRLLALDDLGTEYADKRGMAAVMLDSLLDARYSACLPTVITTNLNGDQFKERYRERVFDRVRDGRFYQCAEPSFRGRRS